jgi:hypothetical protein
MTALAFYLATVLNGRAVLVGALPDPHAWLAKVDGRLYLCQCGLDAIRLVEDDATTVTLPATPDRLAKIIRFTEQGAQSFGASPRVRPVRVPRRRFIRAFDPDFMARTLRAERSGFGRTLTH